MTLFDVLFILLFLTALAVLFSCLVSALRGQRARAGRRLRSLGVAVLMYLALVAGVSLLTPRRVLALGADQCSDDWCIAVQAATRADDTTRAVTFRLTSRARRVMQRERFVVVYLHNSDGRRFNPEPSPEQPPFDVDLAPGASVLTTRRFRVPRNARGLGVIVTREGDVPFPRCCIIGTGILHKDAIVLLP